MNKTFKKLASLSIIAVVSLCSVNTNCMIQANAANSISTIAYEDISTRADIIDWRYKSEDGVIYKRLFNYSKNEWVDDWILIP